MKPTEKTNFLQLMQGLAEMYGKKLSPLLLKMYWRTLCDVELDKIRRAVNLHLRNPENGQFMPKPADLLRLIHGDFNTQALQAWSKVIQAIREKGAYSTVVFDDGLVHCVIKEMSGWVKLCRCTLHELEFKQNEFCKRYRFYQLNPPSIIPSYLPGIMLTAPQPVCFIGDQPTAQLIYQQNSANQHSLAGTPDSHCFPINNNEEIIKKDTLTLGENTDETI